jgi:DNA-binding MarR family transcriptional regulator
MARRTLTDAEGENVVGSYGPFSPETIGEPHQNISALLMKAYFYTRRVYDEAIQPYGVSGTQSGVLVRIYENPGVSGIEISREMLTTPQSVQTTLNALEKKGFIERRPDACDRRFLRAFLTEEGHAVIQQCQGTVSAIERRLGQRFSEAEQEEFVAYLKRYLELPITDSPHGADNETDES